MGWNTMALFLRGLDAPEAAHSVAQVTQTSEWVTAEIATGGSRDGVLYAATTGGWTQLWAPSMIEFTDHRSERESLAVLFSSVVSTYGFFYRRDGEAVRTYLESEEETILDQGEPLPVEAGPFPCIDEDFLWAVIGAVTGARWDDDLRYQVYRLVS